MTTAELEKIIKDLGAHVVVSRDNVNEAMCNQTELFTFYAIAYNRALRDSKLLAFQIEQVEAGVDAELQGFKSRVTERMVRTQCSASARWVELRRHQVEADEARDTLGSILRAMEHRKDMLVNYGATVREEERAANAHVMRANDRNRP